MYWITFILIITIVAFISFSKNSNSVEQSDLPWFGHTSIFNHINSNLDQDGKLTEKGDALPDENRKFSDEDMKWVSGGLDSVFGHHVDGNKSKDEAEKIAALVKKISIRNNQKDKITLYNILLEDSLLDYLDLALEKITQSDTRIEPYLHNYARWLAYESPDRGAVKFGISLLGIISDKNDMDKVITLGKHEEFTLFSAVAISNTYKNPDEHLWNLAKYVDGWGKINIVERLSETNDAEIKKWLLYEGYKNNIMYEYLAYTCAVSGDLKTELSNNPNNLLINSAGEIIQALINGGPAQDIDDYEDAATVISLYTDQIQRRKESSLKDFLVINSILGYISDDKKNWQELIRNGWTGKLIADLQVKLKNIVSKPVWVEKVKQMANTDSDMKFWDVNQSAKILGIDLWDKHWSRLVQQPHDQGRWYNIMENANDERIDQIIEFAKNSLPLDKITTGPSDSLGMGENYNIHGCLDFILQDLDKYPNKGFNLIKAGLRSPTIRNRNMAVKALSSWKEGDWPNETEQILQNAVSEETDEEIKQELRELLTRLKTN